MLFVGPVRPKFNTGNIGLVENRRFARESCLRRPSQDYRTIAGSFAETGGMISYPQALEHEMSGFCTRELLKHVPETLLFPCRLAA